MLTTSLRAIPDDARLSTLLKVAWGEKINLFGRVLHAS